MDVSLSSHGRSHAEGMSVEICPQAVLTADLLCCCTVLHCSMHTLLLLLRLQPLCCTVESGDSGACLRGFSTCSIPWLCWLDCSYGDIVIKTAVGMQEGCGLPSCRLTSAARKGPCAALPSTASWALQTRGGAFWTQLLTCKLGFPPTTAFEALMQTQTACCVLDSQ